MLFVGGALRGQSYEIGVYGGLSLYEGDLAPNAWVLYLQTLNPAYGVFTRVNFGRWIGLRVGYNDLTISGDDAISGRRRGLNFRTDIQELAFTAELNLFRWHIFGSDKIFFVEPYGYGGAAIFQFEPMGFYDGRWVALQPLGTEGQGLRGYPDKYELTQWAIIGGGGVKLHFSPRWILGLEASGRKTFTDYLDDTSSRRTRYNDVLEGNGELAARINRPDFNPERHDPNARYQRGGPATDYYYTFGATLTYVFGPDVNKASIRGEGTGRVKCPDFRNNGRKKRYR
jgi:hypothetical protein